MASREGVRGHPYAQTSTADFDTRDQCSGLVSAQPGCQRTLPRADLAVAEPRSRQSALGLQGGLTCRVETANAGLVRDHRRCHNGFAPAARADDKREAQRFCVVANAHTVQRQAGCTNDVTINPQLQLVNNGTPSICWNNFGTQRRHRSYRSTPQDRAHAAGFRGKVAETAAINPAVAISGIELINQWYHTTRVFRDHNRLRQHQIGVWSENSLDRTVGWAVYGQPTDLPRCRPGEQPTAVPGGPRKRTFLSTPAPTTTPAIEYGINWLPWIPRVYPPPAMRCGQRTAGSSAAAVIRAGTEINRGRPAVPAAHLRRLRSPEPHHCVRRAAFDLCGR